MADLTPLAEKIAREHVPHNTRYGLFDCSCTPTVSYNVDGWGAHIATVTERDVRDRIAAEVRKMRPLIRTAGNGREDRVLRQDAVARAIARGEGS